MDIPFFPDSKPLELTDKPMLDALFASLQPRVSELTFAGLYLFRAAHAYRLAMLDDALVVLGEGYDRVPYFLPPLSGSVRHTSLSLLGEGLALYGADEEFVAEHLQDSAAEVMEDRDNFDYLYLRSDLAQLQGNRYHKKKNRINYFTSRHDSLVETYAERHLAGCQRLLEEWGRVHEAMVNRSMALEIEAGREALHMAAALGLEGLVVLVGGEVKGFVLGERLNNDTSVCHFEKADAFLDGVYQLLDREFSRLLFTDCTYVNREQDLGEPNLRDSKLSYHPVALVKKFRVRRR